MRISKFPIPQIWISNSNFWTSSFFFKNTGALKKLVLETGTGTYQHRPALTELDRHRPSRVCFMTFLIKYLAFLGHLMQIEYQKCHKTTRAGLVPVLC
jgi:hypothetical protein